VLGGDDTIWSCSLGRRSHRDRLDSSVSGDQRPRVSGANTGSRPRTQSKIFRPQRSHPSDHCDTAKHAHMHSLRSSLIRDDLERMQREQHARRELEKHQRRLADEVDRAVARTRPSPWLKPWDPAMTRRRRLRCGRRRMHRAAVDPMAILRRMESRMDAIRRQTPAGVSRRTSLLGRLPARRNTSHRSNISRDES
jgi:hypothetical protein